MRKITFYCQHLLGIGHLTRSLNICEGLVAHFDVHFIQGGEDVGRSLDSERFEHTFLPPLLMNEVSGKVESTEKKPAEEQWLKRAEALSKIANDPGDVLIIELFPFGRKAFTEEILTFIDLCRARNPELRVYSSVRDILVEKQDWDRRQLKIIEVIDSHFDGIFVHSDEQLVPFSMSFQKEGLIRDKVVYTGFISESGTEQVLSREPNRVLVSIGGGIVGDELIESTLEAAKTLTNCRFQVIESPNMNSRLKEKLRDVSIGHLEVLQFAKNFETLLASADLSISMAGYNTTMNLLSTRTFGLVYPYQKSTEQLTRTSILSENKVIQQLSPDDLEPQRLVELISSHLGRSDWDHLNVNLSGAKTTADWLLASLS